MGVKGVFLQYKLKLIKNLDFGKNQKSVFFGCKGSSVLNMAGTSQTPCQIPFLG